MHHKLSMHAKLNPITSEVDEQILHYLLGVRFDAGHEMLRHSDVAVVDLAGTAAAGEDVLEDEVSFYTIGAFGNPLAQLLIDTTAWFEG